MNEAFISKNLEKIEDYKKRRERILQMGGPKAIEERHKSGQMTARERIDYFFDPGTFTEIGLWVKHRVTAFGMDKKEVSAEGIITGFGKVNGRYVIAAAEDYTSMAGSFGEYHGLKYIRAIDFAKEKGWPFANMVDSGGARLQEGTDVLEAYGWLFRAQNLASGIIPQIALLMGPCLGGQGYNPVMQDFLIQNRHTGFMGIAGPAFVKTQTGEEIALEELSGWKAHAIESGQTHVVAEDDKDCLDKAKALLSFLPSNNREKPPRIETQDAPERIIPELNTLLPEQPNQPYDMHRIIEKVVDDGYFFEIMKDYARNMIIGFGRFGGRPVGIVASQPMVMAGAIDVNASDKGARFIRFCDLFNIPLVTFQDSPAFMIGSEQEWKGILRHAAKLLFSWANATVPLVAILVRKCTAGTHYGMLDKSIGGDFEFAWPNAIVCAVGAETAASVIFAREIREAENPEEVRIERINEYRELYENPYRAAERGYVDDVIMPQDTRKVVNRALDVLEGKAVARPWKKYYNIDL